MNRSGCGANESVTDKQTDRRTFFQNHCFEFHDAYIIRTNLSKSQKMISVDNITIIKNSLLFYATLPVIFDEQMVDFIEFLEINH